MVSSAGRDKNALLISPVPQVPWNHSNFSIIWSGSILKLIPLLNSYVKATPEFDSDKIFGIR